VGLETSSLRKTELHKPLDWGKASNCCGVSIWSRRSFVFKEWGCLSSVWSRGVAEILDLQDGLLGLVARDPIPQL
jgi:hypothetical protein